MSTKDKEKKLKLEKMQDDMPEYQERSIFRSKILMRKTIIFGIGKELNCMIRESHTYRCTEKP